MTLTAFYSLLTKLEGTEMILHQFELTFCSIIVVTSISLSFNCFHRTHLHTNVLVINNKVY